MEIERHIAVLGQTSIVFFLLVLTFLIALMATILWLGWWTTNRQGAISPYSKEEMRRGEDLAFSAMEKVQRYLDEFADPFNPTIAIKKAAVCPKTGRIFPNSVNLFGVIKVNWSFLQKHHPGCWVSWGSLTTEQQKLIISCHHSLEDYQTKESAKEPKPMDVDFFHAMLKPGPLYVDLNTHYLLGWKNVPKTSLEVLILQRPYRNPTIETEEKIKDMIIG